MNNNYCKSAIKVSIITIIVNTILSLFKFIAGIVGLSSAMISDAIHSLSDVISTIIVIIGVKISNKKSDKSHQYGHERFEAIASFILGMILFVTGIFIGYSGILKIITGNIERPEFIAILAAIVSIITKEWMYWYTIRVAKKINSTALIADAWHHRSDSLSSIGSLLGILGAQLGFVILDPIASLIICIFILKVALEIIIDSIQKLVDKSVDEEIQSAMIKVIINTEGVIKLDSFKTRLFGTKIYVDVEISADKNLRLSVAHEIAKNVHNNIESNFKNVKHCMVHVNPG